MHFRELEITEFSRADKNIGMRIEATDVQCKKSIGMKGISTLYSVGITSQKNSSERLSPADSLLRYTTSDHRTSFNSGDAKLIEEILGSTNPNA